MKTILQISSSINSGNGESTRLADEFGAGLKRQHPGALVIQRDLAREPVPHLDAERFGAFLVSVEKQTSKQKEVIQYSDSLIAELKRADAIVIGLLTGKQAWVLATARRIIQGLVNELKIAA